MIIFFILTTNLFRVIINTNRSRINGGNGMKSFWSIVNRIFLTLSLAAWISAVLLWCSYLKESNDPSLDDNTIMCIMIFALFVVVALHSLWGMLVEMSKNIITNGNTNSALEKENENLKSEIEKLSQKIDELSIKLKSSKNKEVTQQSKPKTSKKTSELNTKKAQDTTNNITPENKVLMNNSEEDWICNFCGRTNAGNIMKCPECGWSKPSDLDRLVQKMLDEE